MKCAKCGAELTEGKLYCYQCGAEIQIVSPDSVIEEELFLEFQQRELQEPERAAAAKPAEHLETIKSAEKQKSEEQPEKDHGQQLHMAQFAAISGFLLLTIVAALMWIYTIHTGQTEADGSSYEQTMFAALATSDEDAAFDAVSAQAAAERSDIEARFWLAWLYGRQGDTACQIQTLQEILALDAINGYACRELLRLYAKTDDFPALYEYYIACLGTDLEHFFLEYVVDEPKIEIERDPMWEGDLLTITAGEGLNVYYTLDAVSPISGGTLYYAPFTLEEGTYTVAAAACNEKGYYSPVVTKELTVERHDPIGMPQVVPKSGEYTSQQRIYVTVPDGYSAYYTWDGQTPTAASYKYSDSIAMPEGNNVLSVILIDAYGNVSSVQRMNYIYMP